MREVGKEVYRKGGMQERRDAGLREVGQEVYVYCIQYRKGGMQEGGMQEGGIQDRGDAGKSRDAQDQKIDFVGWEIRVAKEKFIERGSIHL